MKKTRDYILFALAFLLSMASCTKNVREPDNRQVYQISEIQAAYCNPQVDESQLTKNEVTDFYYSVVWRTGDEIALVNLTQNRIDRYQYNGADKGKDNVFRAVGGPYSYGESDVVYAVYPYSAASIDGSNLKVTLTDGLTFTSKSNNVPFKTNDIQVSKRLNPASIIGNGSSDNVISLFRIVTLLSVFSVVNEPELADDLITALTIHIDGCAGQATVQFNGDGEPYLSNNCGTANSMKVLLAGSHKLASPTSAAVSFIPLVPSALNGGIKLVFETADKIVGAYNEYNATLGGNRYRDLYFNQRLYTLVNDEENATFKQSWWYTLKAGGMDRAGSFGSNSETNYGSTAGRFTE